MVGIKGVFVLFFFYREVLNEGFLLISKLGNTKQRQLSDKLFFIFFRIFCSHFVTQEVACIISLITVSEKTREYPQKKSCILIINLIDRHSGIIKNFQYASKSTLNFYFKATFSQPIESLLW